MIPTWKPAAHKKGDTFNDRKITFPFVITDCIINMQFRMSVNESIDFQWSTEDGTFEKISPTEITMKKRILNNKEGTYISDLQVTFLDGTNYTYFNVQLQITNGITN